MTDHLAHSIHLKACTGVVSKHVPLIVENYCNIMCHTLVTPHCSTVALSNTPLLYAVFFMTEVRVPALFLFSNR
jgi:hypothetical protein